MGAQWDGGSEEVTGRGAAARAIGVGRHANRAMHNLRSDE